MKRVSFKVAKSIKKAGYPQGILNNSYYNEDGILIKPFVFNGGKEIADAPTYLEVWLWLWREKGITLEPSKDGICVIECENKDSRLYYGHNIFSPDDNKDPEKAIITAIEYLVDNDLIKEK